jgi:predicted phage-related endonuclease
MVGKVTPNTMLSASRLPAVMGHSKYRSPNDELSSSIDSLCNREPADISNQAMELGNTLEPIILKQSASKLQLADLKTDYDSAKYHATLPLACSLDGTADGLGQVIKDDPANGIYVVGQDSIQLDGIGILEAKLTAVAPESSLPLYRGAIQLQAQMDIMQAKWGAVCVLYQGTELRIFLFAPHQTTIKAIENTTLDFQRRLDIWKQEKRIEYYPPVDSKDATRTWGQANEEEITLSGEFETWAKEIHDAKEDIKELEKLIDDRETKIKAAMTTATKATTNGFTISWPMRHYKATPERIVSAKDAYSIRQSTLTLKAKS